jgi:hypothetical protein
MTLSIRNTIILGLLSATSIFAQDYEERPAIGPFVEYTNIEVESFTYKERISEDNGNIVHYQLKNQTLDVTPLIGITAHLPFIWPNYLTANAILAGQFHEYDLVAKNSSVPVENTDNPESAVKYINVDNQTLATNGNVSTKSFSTFAFMIEGGPELGLPLYTNYETQTMFKLLAYGHISFGQSFNFNTNFEKALYFGALYGGGFRYSFQRWSLDLGFKNGITKWHPVYDPAKGEISTEDPKKRNDLEIIYTQVFNPYLSIKWAVY